MAAEEVADTVVHLERTQGVTLVEKSALLFGFLELILSIVMGVMVTLVAALAPMVSLGR